MRKVVTAVAVLVTAVIPMNAAAIRAVPEEGLKPGFMSDNVQYVATVPFDAGLATGARLMGKYLYVAGSKSLSIYDVSDPEAPERLSTTPIGFVFANEDVDTNGKILIMSDDQIQQQLRVWDVEDKTNPREIAVLDGVNDHNFACVYSCRWAYGSRGNIVDLRDPTNPKLAGNWGVDGPPGDGFDITEVSPGMVLTATRIIRLLDGRKDPTNPKEVAAGGTSDFRLIHSVRWPRGGKDKFFLVQGETPFSRRCNENSGAFMTWDASKWKKTKSFSLIDEFRVTNGTYVDGNPPAGVFGCTAMWFQEHPTFKNGGLVASAFFEHGTRFLAVSRKGQISEVGYFTPLGGSTIASYWITKDIVYAIDIQRGIDILRFIR